MVPLVQAIIHFIFKYFCNCYNYSDFNLLAVHDASKSVEGGFSRLHWIQCMSEVQMYSTFFYSLKANIKSDYSAIFVILDLSLKRFRHQILK